MFKRLMLWAPAAALLGGFLLDGGCGFTMNKQWWTILTILQEDLGS